VTVLVVYDTVFGNTAQVAKRIGDALNDQAEVSVRAVADVQSGLPERPDLLIVGSPTRAFQPTPAIKNFLAALSPSRLHGVKVASFDTRVSVTDTGSKILAFFVHLFGYAAETINKRLVSRGGRPAAEPAGFIVTGSEGPMKDGELERAEAWARGLLAGF
jgi:flavodoxin I